MLETLKALCRLNGVSGFEDEVRRDIKKRLAPFADDMRTDAIGNLIVHQKGKQAAGHKVMLCAHMDEVGLIIKRITDDGYLKFDTVGGIDRRILPGKRVQVGQSRIPGVIGIKAYHLVGKEEEKKVPKLEEFYIDIGTKDGKEAGELVTVGDCAAFHSEVIPFGTGLLKAKAIDDRVGCAVMIKLIERPLPMDCTFVFTAQEEVGTRGAFGAAFSIRPEIALVLEGTTAADSPMLPPHKQICAPGKGPALSFMDGGTVYDRQLFEQLRGLAAARGIPWQLKQYLSGGTDARAIQRSREGVRVAAISAAVRYLHTPSNVASVRDAEDMLLLADAFLHSLSTTC